MPRKIILTREKLAELVAKRDEAVSTYPMLAPGMAFSSACGPYLPLLIDCAQFLMGTGGGDSIEYHGPKYATERREELLAAGELPTVIHEYAGKFGVAIEEAVLHYAYIVEGCPADMASGANSICMGGPNVAVNRVQWLRDRRDPNRPRPGDVWEKTPDIYRRVVAADVLHVKFAPSGSTHATSVPYEEFVAWCKDAKLVERTNG